MKHLILLAISVLVLNTMAFCQNTMDTIVINKTYGTTFQQNGKNLNSRQLLKITYSNFAAYIEMRKAKSNLNTAFILSYTGGFLIGWQLGKAISGNKLNWTNTAAGAGLLIFSIPFKHSYNKYAENAIHIYNKGLNQTVQNKITVNFGLTDCGIGIRLCL